ncbi:response regulator transcription factor [Chryseobacterium sp. POL2]|uniref:response regulator n=1 Tax=Chryseobacterium sp. POL2 TaxID=2713414 RepID=UPI0013E14092|nr:response regulator transcription factor [Chryseobacterium sp. POL2]QIG88737.1 response regulator transcription factor [Chryseobacterium sp. POL2]
MPIKVLLYEDNTELRDSLSSLIAFSEDLELVAAYEHCADVLRHLDTYDPEIILMDIDMPVMNGLEGLKLIRSINTEIPVVMLTIFDDNEHILNSIMNGATGYILKQHLTTKLDFAIKEALNGGAPMSPAVARLVLQHINNPGKKNYNLTAREKEILQSLTDGNSYKMIAANEGISIGTVTTHIKNIYEKLGVHSQAEAVSKTLRERIL